MTAADETGTSHRGAMQTIRDTANPASVKGAAAVVAGLTVLLLPDLSLALLVLAVGIGLAVSGAVDLGGAVFGRRPGRTTSRWVAGIRGTAALLAAALVLLVERTSVLDLVGLVGIYLMVRGVIAAVLGAFARERRRRATLVTSGVSTCALGLLATTAPAVLTEGLVILGALASVVLGAIMLTFGLRAARAAIPAYDPSATTVADVLVDWVEGADMGPQRRESLAATLYFEPPDKLGKYTSWWILLLLSVAIATFAVLQDSTAVVIGAMLVAPLMMPILGLAGALVNGWRRRAAASSTLIVAGVAASVLTSYVLSSWAPVAVAFDTNTQITSRVNPNLLDMLIAIAAGAAGAFATVNIRAASSIAGVAIAVALVPPLAVVGVSLGDGRLDDAVGALLLFLTNFTAIVLAAALVFVLGGFVEGTSIREHVRRLTTTLAPFVALALVVLVPLVFNSQGLLAASTETAAAQESVDEWLGEDRSDLRVTRVIVSDDRVSVLLTGSSAPPDLAALQSSLSASLGRAVTVAVSLTPVIVTELGPAGEPTQRAPDLE